MEDLETMDVTESIEIWIAEIGKVLGPEKEAGIRGSGHTVTHETILAWNAYMGFVGLLLTEMQYFEMLEASCFSLCRVIRTPRVYSVNRDISIMAHNRFLHLRPYPHLSYRHQTSLRSLASLTVYRPCLLWPEHMLPLHLARAQQSHCPSLPSLG